MRQISLLSPPGACFSGALSGTEPPCTPAGVTSTQCGSGISATRKATMKKRQAFQDPSVQAVFDAYPAKLRADLLDLRQLIFDTARVTDGVGPLIETLKWRQPAYLPARPKTGSTIRIDALKSREPAYAIFFNCQTTLVSAFRDRYGHELDFDGNRAIILSPARKPPRDALKHCIATALTYHSKRQRT
jgi:hypothetical protein